MATDIDPQNPGANAPKLDDVEMTKPQSISSTTQEEHSHLAPILGVLIVVLVLILGGLYLWGQTLMQPLPQTIEETTPRVIENNEPETERADADVQITQTVSTSDEIDAIEADLESTDLDTIDAELDALNAELEAELGSF